MQYSKAPRIISGTKRGLTLQTPSGMETRPIATRARKSLFDKIQHNENLNDAIYKKKFLASVNNEKKTALENSSEEHLWILDVFAGSGVLGIEAISRWQGQAAFFDNDHSAIQAIRHNLRHNPRTSALNSQIFYNNAFKPPPCPYENAKQISLAFFTPPYSLKKAVEAPEAFARENWFKSNALIIFQTAPLKNKGKGKKKDKNKGVHIGESSEKIPELGKYFIATDILPCTSACFFFFRYQP